MFRAIRFRIDGDVFEAESQISIKRAMRSFFALEKFSSFINVREIDKIINKFLKPRSRKVFNSRMRDINNPINCQTLLAVFRWLWEQYGMRPTKPSPDLFSGLPRLGDGKKSMVNARIPAPTYMPVALISY